MATIDTSMDCRRVGYEEQYARVSIVGVKDMLFKNVLFGTPPQEHSQHRSPTSEEVPGEADGGRRFLAELSR